MENLKINKNKLSAFKRSFTKSIKSTQGKIKKFLATQTSGNVHPSLLKGSALEIIESVDGIREKLRKIEVIAEDLEIIIIELGEKIEEPENTI